LHAAGVHCPVLSFDGAYHKLAKEDADCNPLTALALQLQIWKLAKSKSKPYFESWLKKVECSSTNRCATPSLNLIRTKERNEFVSKYIAHTARLVVATDDEHPLQGYNMSSGDYTCLATYINGEGNGKLNISGEQLQNTVETKSLHSYTVNTLKLILKYLQKKQIKLTIGGNKAQIIEKIYLHLGHATEQPAVLQETQPLRKLCLEFLKKFGNKDLFAALHCQTQVQKEFGEWREGSQ